MSVPYQYAKKWGFMGYCKQGIPVSVNLKKRKIESNNKYSIEHSYY